MQVPLIRKYNKIDHETTARNILQLHADNQHISVGDICKRLGITKMTYYRVLEPYRNATITPKNEPAQKPPAMRHGGFERASPSGDIPSWILREMDEGNKLLRQEGTRAKSMLTRYSDGKTKRK